MDGGKDCNMYASQNDAKQKQRRYTWWFIPLNGLKPSYKWTHPTYTIETTRVTTHWLSGMSHQEALRC